MSSYTIPTVVESTPRGERVSDVYSRLLSERIVFVGTAIDEGVANVVIAQLLHLAADGTQDISLYINSPGGSFSSTLAIYDTMQFIAADVCTLCIGHAATTAALLLAGGADGKRSMLRHARVVLSQPSTDAHRGSLTDLALEAQELAHMRREGEELLALHVGKPADQIRADTDRALILRAAPAVAYGVVDQVMEGVMEGLTAGSSRQKLGLEPIV